MADADYDFGGGYAHRAQDTGARERLTTAKTQRYFNLAGAATSVALVLGLGVWGYKLAVRDVNGVPVIQALDGPMRIAPETPGGEIADYQGLSVNTVAEVGIAAPLPDKLILAPRPVDLSEEDLAGLGGQLMPGLETASAPSDALTGNRDLALAATPLTESADPTEVAVEAALAEALGQEPEAAVAVEPVPEDLPPDGAIIASIRPKARPGSPADVVAATEADPVEVVGADPVEAAEAEPVRAAEAEPVTATALPAPNEVDPATIAPGTRLVQFGTFDTAEEARAEWTRLQARFGALMADKALVVQAAESGGRTFYRLRAYGFAGEDDARRFCTAFVSENAICIPVPHK
jgi:hypothetical protein